MAWLKRLAKEHCKFISNNGTSTDLFLEAPVVFDGATTAPTSTWHARIEGGKDTLYAGDTFHVQLVFDAKYPFDAPQVIFVGNVPMHEHVYSNGHICMSLLYGEWSPSLTAHSLCLALQSMLNSATAKKVPADNASYVRRAPKDPRRSNWVFHDDTC